MKIYYLAANVERRLSLIVKYIETIWYYFLSTYLVTFSVYLGNNHNIGMTDCTSMSVRPHSCCLLPNLIR